MILAESTPADRRQVLADEASAITDACRVIVTAPKITAAFPESTPLAQDRIGLQWCGSLARIVACGNGLSKPRFSVFTGNSVKPQI